MPFFVISPDFQFILCRNKYQRTALCGVSRQCEKDNRRVPTLLRDNRPLVDDFRDGGMCVLVHISEHRNAFTGHNENIQSRLIPNLRRPYNRWLVGKAINSAERSKMYCWNCAILFRVSESVLGSNEFTIAPSWSKEGSSMDRFAQTQNYRKKK